MNPLECVIGGIALFLSDAPQTANAVDYVKTVWETTAEKKGIRAVPKSGFQEGTIYHFEIPYGTKTVSFFTGAADVKKVKSPKTQERSVEVQERVFLEWKKNSRGKNYTGGVLVTVTGQEHRSNILSVNYEMPESTFTSMDAVAAWQAHFSAAETRDLKKENLRFSIEVEPDVWNFYLNGVFMDSLPRRKGSGEAYLSLPFAGLLPKSAENPESPFRPVDITERANAAGFKGKKIPSLSPGGVISAGGIPFLLSRDAKYDNVDLSMSWNEASSRSGYNATLAFRRWPDPGERTPLRFQFRVPAGKYDTLYILAASDLKKDTIPRFSAQFYRSYQRNVLERGAGRPFNFFSGRVPEYGERGSAGESAAIDGADGSKWNLHLIRIPLSGDLLTEYASERCFNLELTKDLKVYRTYPDPLNHSIHGAGLPSAVRIFGITFGKAPVEISFDPAEPGNLFPEGEKVSYTVKLKNTSKAAVRKSLKFTTESYDSAEKHSEQKSVKLASGEEKTVIFSLTPKLFGWHRAVLSADGEKPMTFNRTFVHLRKRDFSPRPFEHQGMRFGCWRMNETAQFAGLTGKIGLDTSSRNWSSVPEILSVFRKYGGKSFSHPWNEQRMLGKMFAQDDPKASLDKVLASLKQTGTADAAQNTLYKAILIEPGGLGTDLFPEYFGEPENAFDYRKFNEKQKKIFADNAFRLKIGAQALRSHAPGIKVLAPHGNWNFLIPFLQNPETCNLSDGVAMDTQYYMRLPEAQIHEVALHSVWYFKKAWEKYRKDAPFLVWGEGPDITQVYPGGTDEETAAAHYLRFSAIAAGYGCHWQLAQATSPISTREDHCAGGHWTGYGAVNPNVSCAALATHSRRMRDAMFDSYTDPGSFSAYCANFKDFKSGELFRMIWNIRGTREFIFDAAPQETKVFDAMDNPVRIESRGGRAAIRVGKMPVYVYGTGKKGVSLGAPDHSDSKPGKFVKSLGSMGALPCEQTKDEDSLYVNRRPESFRRFRTEMLVSGVPGDKEHGERLLSVKLPKQKTDRGVMPYFTCIKFKTPLKIEGKGSHILLQVKANSDWGRVVYAVRDASGRLWFSSGRKAWNTDDMPGESSFCFDGWRLLRCDLPSCSPWDSFFELGMTCWGAEGKIVPVELPLAIEKIFIERRSGVLYGNDFFKIPVEREVLLGNLFVEYASKEDMGDESVRLSGIRAGSAPEQFVKNPIEEMAKEAVLPAGKILSVTDPVTWFDGTRGVFRFEMPPEAVSCDIWIGRRTDGKGALRLGKNLKNSPAEVAGFLPDLDFYAFLVCKTRDGKISKPSAPFKFRMQDNFAHQ